MSELMAGPALAEHVGITYRQFDYWVRRGYIKAARVQGRRTEGTGNYRIFGPDEVRFTEHVAALVHQGMNPKRASQITEKLLTDGFVDLGALRIMTNRRDA